MFSLIIWGICRRGPGFYFLDFLHDISFLLFNFIPCVVIVPFLCFVFSWVIARLLFVSICHSAVACVLHG